jgi:hypothetical protein
LGLAHIIEHPEMAGMAEAIEETLLRPERVVESFSDPQAKLYYRSYVATLARIIRELERQESLRVVEKQCLSGFSHNRRLSSAQPEYDTVSRLSRAF